VNVLAVSLTTRRSRSCTDGRSVRTGSVGSIIELRSKKKMKEIISCGIFVVVGTIQN